MSPPFIANADVSAVNAASPPVIGRVASVYSEVQAQRIDQHLPFPSVLKNPFQIVDGPPSSAAGNPGNIVDGSFTRSDSWSSSFKR